MRGSRGIPARVARLERVRRRTGGACRHCGGGGYPGLFVSEGGGDGDEPVQVGDARCPGCGLVRVGAVVVLPADGEHEWGGGGVEGASL